ncbi:hypothetical protein MSIBF_A210004 [groundwater metagenome]|uniref:Uncharacterized protein n=1 Tax=groundwater metagenome TaxID=717931 RepID=A0A098E9U3_9ZZZZ
MDQKAKKHWKNLKIIFSGVITVDEIYYKCKWWYRSTYCSFQQYVKDKEWKNTLVINW